MNTSMPPKMVIAASYWIIRLLITLGIIMAIAEQEWLLAGVLMLALCVQLLKSKSASTAAIDERNGRTGLLSAKSDVTVDLSAPIQKDNEVVPAFGIKKNTLQPEPSCHDAFFKEGADLVKYIERTATQIGIDPAFSSDVIDKAVAMLERCGADLILEDAHFDINRHEAIPARYVAPQTTISKVIRPGLCKGQRVYLKAKVQIQ